MDDSPLKRGEIHLHSFTVEFLYIAIASLGVFIELK